MENCEACNFFLFLSLARLVLLGLVRPWWPCRINSEIAYKYSNVTQRYNLAPPVIRLLRFKYPQIANVSYTQAHIIVALDGHCTSEQPSDQCSMVSFISLFTRWLACLLVFQHWPSQQEVILSQGYICFSIFDADYVCKKQIKQNKTKTEKTRRFSMVSHQFSFSVDPNADTGHTSHYNIIIKMTSSICHM